MKKALFAGSFDPFTRGHQSIVDRTLAIADEVVIAIGVNSGKTPMFSLEQRTEMIRRVYAGNERVSVESYSGLTTDFAQSVGATFLVRGVRSIMDFETEKNIADVNRKLTGIETVLLITEPEFSSISSSIVRELMSYGRDVTEFLPDGMGDF
ncbi:MAG: pantetheine-phosphate adenylyltransferase [Bacteroidaceae bacterium]|nr:pantetheine-phosphate adenylyltransferase [Bacteroidaceae bacterium]